MDLLPASPKAWSDSSRAVNHYLEYGSHNKWFKRCDDAARTKKHEKFLRLVGFAFLVLQELSWKRKGLSLRICGGKTGLRALNRCVFLDADNQH